MKTQCIAGVRGISLALLAVLLTSHSSAFAQGTAFTYQGRLTENGAPYSGQAEFQPTLWNAASGGSQVAANSPATVVIGVTNGLFVLPLDFGSAFPGADRWLQLEVRTAIGPFTVLAPRQKLAPTPYALAAGSLTAPLPAEQLTGAVADARLSPNVALRSGGNDFTGNQTISGGGRMGINTSNPAAALHVAGTPGTDGILFPDGKLQTTAVAPVQMFANSGAGNPLSTTNGFITTPLTITITSLSQRVLVTSHRAMGTALAGGAGNLNIYIGFRLVGAANAPSVVGAGLFGIRVSQNTRIPIGLSAVLQNLEPGQYDVGIVGSSSEAANWNNNEWGYTTALVH